MKLLSIHGSGYLRFGIFDLASSTRAKYDMQISSVMCLNYLIGMVGP